MRIFLQYFLPLLAPTVFYFVYMAQRRRRAVVAGEEVPDWLSGPVYWYALAGLLLVVASAIWLFAKDQGGAGDKIYMPPRVEGGKVIDGGFRKPEIKQPEE